MLRSPKTNQHLERRLTIAGTTVSSTSLSEGTGLVTLVDNGTGSTTFTFAKAFKRTPVVIGPFFGTSSTIGYVSAKSKTAITILSFAVDGTTAKDAIFSFEVIGWDDASASSRP